MDTYILRIYRRSTTAPDVLHGTVERVGAKARNAFASRDQLWALLKVPAATDEQPPEQSGIDEQDH
jgi:hypothetical protein